MLLFNGSGFDVRHVNVPNKPFIFSQAAEDAHVFVPMTPCGSCNGGFWYSQVMGTDLPP